MQILSQSQRSTFNAVSAAIFADIFTTLVNTEPEIERRPIFDAFSRTLANAEHRTMRRDILDAVTAPTLGAVCRRFLDA